MAADITRFYLFIPLETNIYFLIIPPFRLIISAPTDGVKHAIVIKKIFSPKSIEKIKIETFEIENRYNKSGFLGFGKVKSQADIDLWELNKKILDVLRRRNNIYQCCYNCKGTDINIWDIKTFLNYEIIHPKCGGIFQIEEGLIVLGSNLGYAGSTFTGQENEIREEYLSSRNIKGKLLDPNDKIVSYC